MPSHECLEQPGSATGCLDQPGSATGCLDQPGSTIPQSKKLKPRHLVIPVSGRYWQWSGCHPVQTEESLDTLRLLGSGSVLEAWIQYRSLGSVSSIFNNVFTLASQLCPPRSTLLWMGLAGTRVLERTLYFEIISNLPCRAKQF